MEKTDVLVIGAGIIGAAVARAFCRRGRSVLLLERHAQAGTETTSRNSQVIHAGIYYPLGSQKARFCVEGNKLLYEYCRQREIPHFKCGKLIVATHASQLPTLVKLQAQAQANGVMDTSLITNHNDIGAMEPLLTETENCMAALHSPSTGIVDSHILLQHVLMDSADAADSSCSHVMNARVTNGRFDTAAQHYGLQVQVDHELWLHCTTVVNCAGLHAPTIANLFFAREDNTKDNHMVRHFFAKGNYFRLNSTGKPPFSRLIYPIPEPGGLGIHATMDLSGSIRFGPDVEWIDPTISCPDQIHLKPTMDRVQQFYNSIRQYWPTIPDGCLEPDYAGIRPKLQHPKVHAENFQSFQDFRIEGHGTHGIKGLVNLLGIESPGLTSCLAIAEYCTTLDQ